MSQLAENRPDFPEPYAITRGVKRAKGMRLWKPEDIEAWSRTANREPGTRIQPQP